MKSLIDRELVLKLAALSRLDLSEAEVEEIRPKLSMMLDLVGQLRESAVGKQRADADLTEKTYKSRVDVVEDPLGRDVALKLAADVCEGHFRVAKIIE